VHCWERVQWSCWGAQHGAPRILNIDSLDDASIPLLGVDLEKLNRTLKQCLYPNGHDGQKVEMRLNVAYAEQNIDAH
jgi:hypothetical protein